MKSIFDKASFGLNLMITNKLKIPDLVDCLIDLKIVVEETEKINNNEKL